MAAKSKTSVNWSEDEKKYLLGLIEAKIDIIECKRVDVKANKRETTAWKTIYEGYKSKYGNFRSISQIKDQWHFKVLRKILVDLTENKDELDVVQLHLHQKICPYRIKQIQINNFLFYSILQSLIPNDFDSLTNPFDDDFPVPNDE